MDRERPAGLKPRSVRLALRGVAGTHCTLKDRKRHPRRLPHFGVRPSTTDDHVFARKWFLEARRADLPQVPACDVCNGAKAKLESELMVVLPFGGRHADATENLARLGGRRFVNDANIRHALRVQRERTRLWVREGGVLRRGMTVPVDWDKVERLSEYIARGLAWHEFDRLQLGDDCYVEAYSLVGSIGRTLRHFRHLMHTGGLSAMSAMARSTIGAPRPATTRR